MLTKYLIHILLSLFIKNAIGQTTTEEMPSTWKTEMTEIFVDKLRLELSKLRDNLERRFDFVTKLEEKLEEYSESKLEKSLEGKLEENLGKKLEENLEKKLETKLEENLRKKLEEKLENDLGKKLEVKLEKNLEKKLEIKLEENLREKLEEKLEVALGKKLERKLERILEQSLGKKLEVNLEKKLERKLEEKLEDNLGKKLEEKLEDTLDKKYEDKFEQKHNISQTEEWVETSIKEAILLDGRALIAGYESDGSPLWITKIYTKDKDYVPGKLNLKQQIARSAYPHDAYSYVYVESISKEIYVLCAPLEKVRWVECRNGYVPPNAVVGGYNNHGETAYIGRAREQGALIPGWVLPTKKLLYIVSGENKKTHDIYEILCLV